MINILKKLFRPAVYRDIKNLTTSFDSILNRLKSMRKEVSIMDRVIESVKE